MSDRASIMREPAAESPVGTAAPAHPRAAPRTPPNILAVLATAGNTAVVRTMLRRQPATTNPTAPPVAAPPVVAPPAGAPTKKSNDAFEGKSYDLNTKAGALDHASDWHTQLLWDYDEYTGRTVVTDDQLIAGRAFFVYTVYYWPKLKEQAESAAPTDVVRDTIKAVNLSLSEATNEDTAATRLVPPADFRTLFPERFAGEYDAEAAAHRAEAEQGRDQREEYKVKAAKEGRREDFVDWAEYQTYQLFAAKKLDEEAKRIRKGQWDALTFKDLKLFFVIEGREEARAAAATEWDAYVMRAKDPHTAWEEGHKKQFQTDLDNQSKEAGDDLLSIELFATRKRLELGEGILPKPVLDAWRAAELALTKLNPAIRAGKVPRADQDAAADAVNGFYTAFRGHVAHLDRTEEHELSPEEGGTIPVTTNPYLGGALIGYLVKRLREAKTPTEWQWPVDQYRNVTAALDEYIADQLKAKGRGAEGEQLKTAGKMHTELANLIDRKPDVKKVRAVFYPKDEIKNAGAPGTPDFRAKGIPLYFYLYREDEKWNLVDLTTPHKVKVTRDGGGSDTRPPDDVFTDLDSKLRFPEGRLYWALPDGTMWTIPTTEPWRLSEWLTWIGLAAGAVALAIVSVGATVPATVMVIGGIAGAGAAAADFYEKSEAGVITTQDVVIDTLSFAGNLATLGAAGLGKVVAAGALKTGQYAKLAVLADKFFVPVTLGAMGADVASFLILLGDAQKQLDEIDRLEGSDEDRRLARARLIGQLLLMGTLTILSVRGSLPGIRRGQHLYLDTEPNGTLIARPHLTDQELLKAGAGLKSPESVTDLIQRTDLPAEMLDRLRAGVSQALSVGPIERSVLEDLLARLRTAKGADVQTILTELTSRSRIGAYLGEEAAGAVTPRTALSLNDLEKEALTPLKGATTRELEHMGALTAQDPKRSNALAKEYSAELLDSVRFPVTDLDELENTLVRARKEVKGQVPGLLESVDTKTPPDGLTFKDREYVTGPGGRVAKIGDHWPPGKRTIETEVKGPDGTDGSFTRTYDPDTGVVEMEYAFLRLPGRKVGLPSKTKHPGTQMTPEGTPTVQYITLYQLKRLGATTTAGAVREIAMRKIQNIETIVQLHWLRQTYPGKSVNELIALTESVKYARTTAVQSGYEPGPCTVSGERSAKIGELMAFQARGKPNRIDEHTVLLAKYGFTRMTYMDTDFDITFPVRTK